MSIGLPKLTLNHLVVHGLSISAVQVGFESSSYTVKEGDGYVRTCIVLPVPVDRDIMVVLSLVYTNSAKGTFLPAYTYHCCCY